MNKSIQLFVSLFLFTVTLLGQTSRVSYEKQDSFFPNVERINKESIEWGYLTVPENWDNSTIDKKIKLAVAILKNTSGKEDEHPVVIIGGGPGGGTINIGFISHWLNHPLRDKHDIILIDARGTGFSEPRLCPNLGEKFLEIFAKNQEALQDEQEKAASTLACKRELLAKGIDIGAYHSKNMAKDLHALKESLNYRNWNVYSVSYGTYIAQVYADRFPNDIKTLILDSPISNISEFYEHNTSNYIGSLNKLFKACKDDPNCDKEYPNLEKIYDQTVEKLEKTPITVKVEKEISQQGTFTYNAQDFKIGIYQALYQKSIIEVLPLLIYEFYNENKDALSTLSAVFRRGLSFLDYGTFYCVTCNEVFPSNSIEEYEKDRAKHPSLNRSISFYKSDFAICDQWNKQSIDTVKNDSKTFHITAPTLIFAGNFDPITPVKNGRDLLQHLEKGQLLEGASYGHGSSFSKIGSNIVNEFINNPSKEINAKEFQSNKIKFVNDIYINGGIAKLGNSISRLDLFFLAPLCLALLISIISIFAYSIALIRKKEENTTSKIIKLSLIVNSILGLATLIGFVIALNNTASKNGIILAFGLPQNYTYLFKLLWVFLATLFFAVLLFLFKIKKIKNRSIILLVLFSNVLIAIYFFYWGLI